MELYKPVVHYYNVGKIPIVGKSCSLVNTLLDCVEQITIGDYVSFGHDCMLLTGKHDYTFHNAERQTISINKPIIIGNGVWIASGVIVGGGVTIGDNAVIGAGSVVLKDIPANELWAGSPARFIKKI